MATNAHCRLLTNFVQQLHIHAHSEVQPASNNAIIRVVMQMTGDTGIPIYSHNHLGKARNFCQTFSSAARIAKASRSLISSMIMHCGVRIVFCDRMYVFKAHLVYCSVNALMTSQHWVNLQKIKTASLSCSLWVRTSQYLSFSKRMPSYWASKTYEFRRSVSRGFHHRRPVCLIVMSCDSKHSTTNICDYHFISFHFIYLLSRPKHYREERVYIVQKIRKYSKSKLYAHNGGLKTIKEKKDCVMWRRGRVVVTTMFNMVASLNDTRTQKSNNRKHSVT